MKVAYLGPEKTFTEKVTKELFPQEELIPLIPIRKVIMAVETGEVQLGVVGLENFYNGEVRETLDVLTKAENARIIMEKAGQVVHCFGALPNHKEINKIYSHPQAIEQCSEFLYENYPNATVTSVGSTAEAANLIAKNKEYDSAAIAPKPALLAANLEVLAEDICPNNKTRFIVIGREKTQSTGDDKTLLAIHPPIRDKSGVLHHILGFFAGLEVNLEYIQSRPDRKKGYYFYIEVDGHKEDKLLKHAIEGVRLSLDPEEQYTDTIKVLGSYPNSHWKDDN